MRKQKAIVSVTNDLFTDNRVRKVCEFLVRHSFEVTLVGRRLPSSPAMPDLPYRVKRFRLLFNKGPLFYAAYNLRLFLFLVFRRADVLVANDLDTLYANHWARKFRRNCRLVYDAHEYFTGVPELVGRPGVQKIWKWIERRTVPRADRFYTVNDSIAELYRDEYQREVLVVRNIADYQSTAPLLPRSELGVPPGRPVVILQGAGINIQRGAEELVDAIALLPEVTLIIVGSGDVLGMLKEKVRTLGLEKRVLFFGKQPYARLLNYTAISDIGVSLDKDTNINYRFSLPNKVFDYIHAGIPQLVSDLPEVSRVVKTYDVGLVCPSHEPAVIAAYLKRMLEDKELYSRLRANTAKAAAVLNWENECKVLEKIYL